jgi:hypothetical protein
MVVLSVDGDYLSVDSRHNVETRESYQRARSPKAGRSIQKSKKSGSPGSIRLRRNKHWSW